MNVSAAPDAGVANHSKTPAPRPQRPLRRRPMLARRLRCPTRAQRLRCRMRARWFNVQTCGPSKVSAARRPGPVACMTRRIACVPWVCGCATSRWIRVVRSNLQCTDPHAPGAQIATTSSGSASVSAVLGTVRPTISRAAAGCGTPGPALEQVNPPRSHHSCNVVVRGSQRWSGTPHSRLRCSRARGCSQRHFDIRRIGRALARSNGLRDLECSRCQSCSNFLCRDRSRMEHSRRRCSRRSWRLMVRWRRSSVRCSSERHSQRLDRHPSRRSQSRHRSKSEEALRNCLADTRSRSARGCRRGRVPGRNLRRCRRQDSGSLTSRIAPR
jgi:hypothetical protein